MSNKTHCYGLDVGEAECGRGVVGLTVVKVAEFQRSWQDQPDQRRGFCMKCCQRVLTPQELAIHTRAVRP